MEFTGIVCEYNPFHNGHAYHIAETKRRLGAPVVCVMSGDFVQRGEAAMFSKFARAEAAVRGGADVVLELPLPWSLASAERFARGSVGLLAALGAKTLSFGSESGDLAALETLARELLRPDVTAAICETLTADGTLSFAQARQQVLAARLGAQASALETPNNILAVEYLKAIYDLHLSLEPFTLTREGSTHDGAGEGEHRSASELRVLLRLGRDISTFSPAASLAVYEADAARGRGMVCRENLELAVLSRLRALSLAEYERLPDAADGLGRRLYRAARSEPTLDAVMAAAKTRRYAMSRVRRACMCAALGVREGMAEGVPPYARLLAANETGCALLAEIGKHSALPILTKPAAVRDLSVESEQVFLLGASAHDLYTLGYGTVEERRAGMDWKTSPKIVKNG